MNESPLSEQNHFKKDDTSIDKSPSNQGAWHDHCPSPGEVQSRFQEISEEVQSNQGQVSISVTWGIEHQSR